MTSELPQRKLSDVDNHKAGSVGEQITNGLSVDVEDYFQVGAFENQVRRESWEQLPSRVRGNVYRILEVFDQKQVKATFFILAWVAQRYPQMVRDIASAGHEIASHGCEHQPAFRQSPEEFYEDISSSKKILEDLSGQPVLGYRAPSFSIIPENSWAFGSLESAGYRYSSSIYPIRHDFYGYPDAPRFPFVPDGTKLLECPQSTVEIGPLRIPCGGGGYLRLLPFRLFCKAIERINKVDREAMYLYLHPWEIDPWQPRIEGAGFKSRFRHYRNLEKTERRLTRLLELFNWGRFDEILKVA